jgi:hypothetical protein
MYWAKIATTMIAAAMARIAFVEAATSTRLRSYPRYLLRKRYAASGTRQQSELSTVTNQRQLPQSCGLDRFARPS